MRVLRSYRPTVKVELLTSIEIIVAAIIAIIICNSSFKSYYDFILNNIYITQNISIHVLINDFLMSIFFLVAGLEIKHELLYGNLSSLKKASFPVLASIGGVIFPALIYIIINKNTDFLNGFCIPISTDIAFAVGVFLIFSNKFNPSLKVFLLSLAVVDDLISIIAIGCLYSININLVYILIAICILFTLFLANKIFFIENTWYYMVSGLCLWYFVHLSGIHSTISGILLALVIPAKPKFYKKSCLERLQEILNPFNSLIIMPLFAFANTGISMNFNFNVPNSEKLILGIVLGLCLGKPLGIMCFSYLGDFLGIIEKPKSISWLGIFFVSLLAGIGFTMSIFVSEIAFLGNNDIIDLAKMSILLSCIISILLSITFILLYILFKKYIMRNTSYLSNKYYIN